MEEPVCAKVEGPAIAPATVKATKVATTSCESTEKTVYGFLIDLFSLPTFGGIRSADNCSQDFRNRLRPSVRLNEYSAMGAITTGPPRQPQAKALWNECDQL